MSDFISNVSHVNARATEVARASYGRLVAMLSSRTGDILVAEDALGDAFQRALETWPIKGIPNNPEAWIFTTARNRLIDTNRKDARYPHDSLEFIYDELFDELNMNNDNPTNYSTSDDRLKLLFVCAHPAIDPKIHTPLMLQTVLGLDAQTIGNAFLISPSSMSQRLVRAKRKIRDAGIPFVFPEPSQLAARLNSVLEAIYGAFSVDWMSEVDALKADQNLSDEAFFLVNLLMNLLPNEPEVLGLSSYMSFSNSRKDARYTSDAHFIPLDKQDVKLWDKDLIAQAELILLQAHKIDQLGRFQLEAAIQSVHCNRLKSNKTDWHALAQLYEGLQKIAPTIGGAVARASVMGEAFGAKVGLDCLKQIDIKVQRNFQPAWATRAYLLDQNGDTKEAIHAYQQAIGLTTHIPVRQYLLKCCENLKK